MCIPVINKLEMASCHFGGRVETLSISLQSQVNKKSHKTEELNNDMLIWIGCTWMFHNIMKLSIRSISLLFLCLDRDCRRRQTASERRINQRSRMAGAVWHFSLDYSSSPVVCWWDLQHTNICENCEADAGLTWPMELNSESLLGCSEISKVWGWVT